MGAAAVELEAHPDYLAAAPERQWSGTVADLWAELKREAHRDRGRLSRAWRILPSGALVALTIGDEFRKLARISRSRAPGDELERARWEKEVQQLAGSFALLRGHRWWTATDPNARGIAWLLQELYGGELEPGRAKCRVCGELCKWEASFAPDGCAHTHCLKTSTHPGARQLP
ncbi:MAG TPA: hypothetical protein VFX29_00820 [Longimicrobiaceae bacterium]|nr:hypothetical protein [Longimicrobiaceae bacterium]